MLSSLSTADQARLSRSAALAVCIIAGAICLWLLVRLAWLLVPQADTATATAPTYAPTSSAQPVQSVAKWHLFGNPQSVLQAQAARAPTTTLKLTLRGTLAMPDAQQGIAMIEDEHGSEGAYKVGEEVASGVKLTEVYTDHVVLSHEGATETLSLPQPEAHAPPLPDAGPSKPATANATAAGSPKASSIPPNYTPPQFANGAAADWSKMQTGLRMDTSALVKQVHVEPVYENGKLAGARLSAGGQLGTLISQAGLKATDTITAVNGTSVTDLSKLQQMTDNLQSASSLQVTVLRDGKPATLTLNLR
jgi:general secretion pathway protein C